MIDTGIEWVALGAEYIEDTVDAGTEGRDSGVWRDSSNSGPWLHITQIGNPPYGGKSGYYLRNKRLGSRADLVP